MRYEVEQKFYCGDLEAVAAALDQLPVRWHPVVEQVDRYFAHPCRDFAHTDEALRLRQVGDRHYITYKGAKIDSTTKTRQEIELPLEGPPPDRPGFDSLLVALGFQPVGEVRKQRRVAELIWNDVPFEVALDDVQGLGTFVELETAALETAAHEPRLDAARDALASLAVQLSLTHPERRSYLELLGVP